MNKPSVAILVCACLLVAGEAADALSTAYALGRDATGGLREGNVVSAKILAHFGVFGLLAAKLLAGCAEAALAWRMRPPRVAYAVTGLLSAARVGLVAWNLTNAWMGP